MSKSAILIVAAIGPGRRHAGARHAGPEQDRVRRLRKAVEQDVRFANITIIEGIGVSQYGIGMVSARVAEVILRDERAVFPAGSYNPRFGTTVSLPSVVGRHGVIEVLEPAMSDEEKQGLERSAARLKETVHQSVSARERS
jgi:L-lactate dehydrogenase